MKGVKLKQKAKKLQPLLESKKVTIILLLIPVLLALIFRLYPAWLPITDDWAHNSIKESYIQQATAQIRTNFPVAPPEQIRNRAEELWQEYYQQNKAQVDNDIKQLSKQFKSRLQLTLNKKDGTPYEQTYYLAIDPYQHLRRAENIILKGTVCDEIRNGVCWNNHVQAPYGAPMQSDLHIQTEVLFMRAGMLFGFAPMTGAFFLPAIIAALSMIPAFFIIKRKYGDIPAAIGSSVIGLHVAFLGRTPAGFVDTDIWNMFFPLLLIYLLIKAIEDESKKQYLWIAIAGITTGIYSKYWTGYFFSFFVLVISLAGVVTYEIIKWILAKKKIIKKFDVKYLTTSLTNLAIYVLSTGVIVSIIDSPKRFLSAFTTPFRATTGLQDPIKADLWPNVLTTVAELNTVSVPGIIQQIGGKLLFIAATLSIIILATRKQKHQEYYVGGAIIYYLLLTSQTMLGINEFLWFALYALPMAAVIILSVKQEHNPYFEIILGAYLVAALFATTQGVRFLILAVPAYGIAIGITTGYIIKQLPPLLKKHLQIPSVWSKAIAILIVTAVLFTPAHANMIVKAHQVGKSEVPSMNDAWWASLKAINQDSDPNAIITSWWDFGHWFKYVADRAVNFDGGSQTLPHAHWVGKLLQTDSEKESIAILRMINCGANKAFEEIADQINNNRRAYHLVREIILQTPQEAKNTLMQEGITAEKAEEIVSTKTHCTPPDSYLIVSDDMIGKAGVWAHFGLWDFDKSFVYATYKSMPRSKAIQKIKEELDIDETKATQLYTEVASLQSADLRASRQKTNSWISPWPGYMGLSNCQQDETTITCYLRRQVGTQQGISLIADTLVVDKQNVTNTTINVVAQGRKIAEIKPAQLIINDKEYNLNGEFGMGIRIENNTAIIADPLLVNSMFTKTFYEEKEGEYLELLTKQVQITGGKILVYKVNWDSFIQEND